MGAENTLTVRLVECAKTAAQWAALLTIPKRGEVCLEMENQGTNENPDLLYKMKIGDGIHTYANLNYFPVDANIAQVVASWVEQNLDVNEYAQASYDDTTKKLSVYGIKEVDGKIVKGTNHVDIQLAEGTKIDITSAAGVITIAHEGTTRTDTTKSSAGYGTDVVTGVTTDSTGHVTGVETGPLPTKPATKNVIGTSAAATTDGASANPYLNHIEDGDVKSHHQLIGGTQVDVNSDENGQVTIKHETITRSDTEESAQPTNLVTEITTANGHVTGTKTIKPDDLIVGIAKDLDAPVVRSDNSMWNHRVTGGTINIGEETAKIPVLKGNTIVWNQMNDITKWHLGYSSVLTPTGNTVSGSAILGYYHCETAILVASHKYLLRGHYERDYNLDGILNFYGDPSYTGSLQIGTPMTINNGIADFDFIFEAKEGQVSPRIGMGTSVSYNSSLANCMLFDLTKMFGAGNEPATVEEFEAMFPNSYYPYNEGELLSLKPTGVKSIGFNLWDEEWESGSINSNGQPITSHTNIRAKNYIPALGNTEYKISCLNVAITQFVTYFYDANENMIPYTGTGAYANGYNGSTGVFTTPSGTAFMRFRTTDVYGTTYNHDICINISDPSRNGTYEPYKEFTLDLSWIKSIKDSDGNQLFPYGLLSAGSVHDEVGDNYAVKRIGVVDLGTLSWEKNTTSAIAPYFVAWVSDCAPMHQKTNFICSKYISIRRATASGTDKTSFFDIDNTIQIKDSDYSDKDVFKSAMQGVMLYYELAEPVTVYFDKKSMTYPVDDLGTETLLPEGVDSTTGVPLSAPFNGTFEYKSNFKDAVIDLIATVNAYKNPVRGEDNSDQTVGQLAEYDSDSTVKASGYKASNATISPTGSDNASVLPTVAALIAYVQGVAQNALHYQGTVATVASLPSTGTTAGDVYILSATDGNYDAGDWFIRNKANDGWDVVQGSVRVTNNDIMLTPDGTKKTIANVEGTDITVTMPDMNFAEPTASGDTLTVIDTISQSGGKISATKKNIQEASKSQKGVVQFVSDVHNSTDQTKAVTAGDAWTEFAKRNVKAVDVSQSTPINLFPSVLVSSSAPSASTAPSNWDSSIYGTWTGAPQFVGQLFVSTSGSASIATGTSDITDWKPITNN